MVMFKFEDEWMEMTPYLKSLNSKGYTVLKAANKYILYSMNDVSKGGVPRTKVLRECETIEELENFCKLLLPEKEEQK